MGALQSTHHHRSVSNLGRPVVLGIEDNGPHNELVLVLNDDLKRILSHFLNYIYFRACYNCEGHQISSDNGPIKQNILP